MSTETSKRKRLFGASRSRGLDSVTVEQRHGWRQEWLRDRVSSCRQEIENTQGIMTLCRSLKLIPSDILSLTKPRLLTSPQKSPTEEPSLQIPEHFGGLLFKKTTASLHSFLPGFLCSFDDCPNIGWTFPVSYGIFPVCLVWPCLWCVCVFFTYEFRLV